MSLCGSVISVFVDIFMLNSEYVNQTTPPFGLNSALPSNQRLVCFSRPISAQPDDNTAHILQPLVCVVDVTQQLSAGFVLLHSLCFALSRKCTPNWRFNSLTRGRTEVEAFGCLCLPLYSDRPVFLQ